jgi:hypothetical protein
MDYTIYNMPRGSGKTTKMITLANAETKPTAFIIPTKSKLISYKKMIRNLLVSIFCGTEFDNSVEKIYIDEYKDRAALALIEKHAKEGNVKFIIIASTMKEDFLKD